MISQITTPEGGVIFSAVYTGVPREVAYASLTAPNIVQCTVTLNGEIIDIVYAGAGGSHSWWIGAGGGLLRHPVQTGDRLEVTVSGPAAFRIDW